MCSTANGGIIREAFSVRRTRQSALCGCVGRGRGRKYLLFQSAFNARDRDAAALGRRYFTAGHLCGPVFGFYRNNQRCAGDQIQLRKSGLVGTVSESLQKQADFLGEGLTGFVLRHFGNRYPELKIEKLLEAELEREKRLEEEKEKAGRFAVGCGFYKLVSLFFTVRSWGM